LIILSLSEVKWSPDVPGILAITKTMKIFILFDTRLVPG
jgi:hypothetical protein